MVLLLQGPLIESQEKRAVSNVVERKALTNRPGQKLETAGGILVGLFFAGIEALQQLEQRLVKDTAIKK